MPKVLVSVMQRPPTWSAASSTTNCLRAAASRRPAAMPAAPAPTMTASTQPERGTSGARAGRRAASAGAAVRTAAEEARNDRRLKRLMAHRVSKRCEVYHGTRATHVLNLFPLSPCLRYRHSDALFEVSTHEWNEGRQR